MLNPDEKQVEREENWQEKRRSKRERAKKIKRERETNGCYIFISQWHRRSALINIPWEAKYDKRNFSEESFRCEFVESLLWRHLKKFSSNRKIYNDPYWKKFMNWTIFFFWIVLLLELKNGKTHQDGTLSAFCKFLQAKKQRIDGSRSHIYICISVGLCMRLFILILKCSIWRWDMIAER